jgi:ribulose 1,5-bisphosphate synthetase/thiazole synthase
MSKKINYENYDVVVIGGGCAGIAAAVAAAKNGARTLILESGPMIGSDLLAGLPIDGCLSSRGEWIVKGVAQELFDMCEKMGGYIGAFSDRRALWMVAVDPEVMNIAIIDLLHKYNVDLRLYTFAEDVVMEDGEIKGVIGVGKSGRTMFGAKVFIDCTGDGDIAASAGAPYEIGSDTGELQPVSMVFRMSNVDIKKLLQFIVDHPENAGLAENPIINKTKEECARELYELGLPKVFFEGSGPLLSEAIASGEMYPCSMLAVIPVSMDRNEVSINSTRVSGVNALYPKQLSDSLPGLTQQVKQCAGFLKKRVPGFENAVFSGIAPKIGIRETRRIMGEYVLKTEDILEAKKSDDGVAKGGHELDIHGSAKNHDRKQIKDAGSYDIPYGCLIPLGINNMLIAGRCISSTREAHSSARVMGTCMATGQAAGTAAAISASAGKPVRDISIGRLRDILKEQGAILDGTY